jgi:mannose/cellobiose epimerase-like protein (N-acyl-D-glucosamine 2-epimerase family)
MTQQQQLRWPTKEMTAAARAAAALATTAADGPKMPPKNYPRMLQKSSGDNHWVNLKR